jgi:ubiquitin C-terminal hydrolase
MRVKKTWVCDDCGEIHVKSQKEIGIQLPMPDNKKKSRTLQWYLDEYFAKETLSEVECHSNACKIKQDVYKKGDRERFSKIVGGPEILVIQLMRMRMGEFGDEKIVDRVRYSDRLDLSEYSDGYLSYQLNGVVAHKGDTLIGGHYVSMVRSQKGNGFVICNDEEIDGKKTKAQVLLRAEGKEFQSYLLVYQKIGGRMVNCI